MTRKRAKTVSKEAETEEIFLKGPPVWAELLKVGILGAFFMLGMAGMSHIVAQKLVDHITERRKVERRSHSMVSGHRIDCAERKRVPVMAIVKATKPKEKEIDLFEYKAKLIHVVDGFRKRKLRVALYSYRKRFSIVHAFDSRGRTVCVTSVPAGLVAEAIFR